MHTLTLARNPYRSITEQGSVSEHRERSHSEVEGPLDELRPAARFRQAQQGVESPGDDLAEG
jgi:hypothetical protein